MGVRLRAGHQRSSWERRSLPHRMALSTQPHSWQILLRSTGVLLQNSVDEPCLFLLGFFYSIFFIAGGHCRRSCVLLILIQPSSYARDNSRNAECAERAKITFAHFNGAFPSESRFSMRRNYLRMDAERPSVGPWRK